MNDVYISPAFELYHFGIKGMKWGVRRYQNEDGSYTAEGKARRRSIGEALYEHKVRRTARKDAKEFARAKMYYGEGAGNRRKLIKATVEERSKDPLYKKYYDEGLSNQDMAQHARKAASERSMRDTVRTGKRFVTRTIPVLATTVGGAAVFYMNNKQAVDAFVKKVMRR